MVTQWNTFIKLHPTILFKWMHHALSTLYLSKVHHLKKNMTPDFLVQILAPLLIGCDAGQVSSLRCLRAFAFAVLSARNTLAVDTDRASSFRSLLKCHLFSKGCLKWPLAPPALSTLFPLFLHSTQQSDEHYPDPLSRSAPWRQGSLPCLWHIPTPRTGLTHNRNSVNNCWVSWQRDRCYSHFWMYNAEMLNNASLFIIDWS